MVLLSGILFSFLLYPLIYILDKTYMTISTFIFVCLLAGIMDLIQFIYWYYEQYKKGNL